MDEVKHRIVLPMHLKGSNGHNSMPVPLEMAFRPMSLNTEHPYYRKHWPSQRPYPSHYLQ